MEEGKTEELSQNLTQQRGGEEEEEKAGGFLRNFISNMVSTEGSEEKKGEVEKESGVVSEEKTEQGKGNGFLKNFMSNRVCEEEEEEEEEEEKKSGFLKNLISNMVNAEEGKEVSNVVDCEKTGEGESDKSGGGGGGGGGGGIIDNIVSHLPASLQGDAVTTTDEAAMLIHSVIHE
ncbi:hypothetical protein SDJN02_11431, partial [Cucurbita argyrosperma subsp. argyrosperma]|uniref:Cilia- and flagella-associated protein 251-like n=1 Tax=Cucurbita moschata TaxID=3662 RepID=A0A6J1EVJ3_CUCMO